MPQSLSRVLLHLVFSTKLREPVITPEVQPKLHAYIAGILDNLSCTSLRVGGTEDHVHVLCVLARTLTQADLVMEVKKSSSKWMKREGKVPQFSWQAGYGAFSIGESHVQAAVRYIENQQEHHRKMTFQEEFRKLLQRYNVAYDERYMWD